LDRLKWKSLKAHPRKRGERVRFGTSVCDARKISGQKVNTTGFATIASLSNLIAVRHGLPIFLVDENRKRLLTKSSHTDKTAPTWENRSMAKKNVIPSASVKHSGEAEMGELPDTSATTDESRQPESARDVEPISRVYRGTQTVDHDLFKLNVAVMKKNVSYTDIPDMQNFEHCHIFHTVDSGGRKQTACNDVGGHHHDIEVVPPQKGGVPTLRISGPRKWVRDRRRGRLSVPVDSHLSEEDQDRHTHTFTYLGSEKIKLREPNVEYAKFEAAIRAKQEPTIEGVESR
jgi:hypothetical protein